MKVLSGHVSPETAYVVDDYPFGFKLRCKIRYWVEFKANNGFRCVSQTTNPRRGNLIWNKPKAGTYSRFGGALYLDSQDRVQFAGLSEYSSGADAAVYQANFGEAIPEAGRKVLAGWVAAKLAYDASRNKTDPLSVGLPEARAAFVKTVTQ